MMNWFKDLFRRKPIYTPGPPPEPLVVFGNACLEAMQECMAQEIRNHHEGVCYLLGQSDGRTTLAVAAVRPEARTTAGSFSVSSPAMAKVVRAATQLGLQVVGQAHTHPGEAYHSDGDVDGARIAYYGFVSLVLPDYGKDLPSLRGAALFMYRGGEGFKPVDKDRVRIINGRVE